MPTVRFELTRGFRPEDLEPSPIGHTTGNRQVKFYSIIVSGEWVRTTDLPVMSRAR